ncbi:MAG: NACHT domain-containing protein, partial [Clostridia bacterium]|nr:NACHT domain-containing protein [Clostridia bacterium]
MSHIRQYDVFISWTGKDAVLKDRIVKFLRENKIEVLESGESCAGDFRQWSREAATTCTIFLSLYTENTIHSQWVPAEIDELVQLDDWSNRCVPVVSDYGVYATHCSKLAEAVSAVILNGRELTDGHLAQILTKVQTLISNRLLKVYNEATRPTYLKLRSLLRLAHVPEREFDYESLYIPRTVIDSDGNAIDDAAPFIQADDIFFLQGPAGSGKSCYIDQLRKSANESSVDEKTGKKKTLVMALPCRKLANIDKLFPVMYDEFCRHCGNRDFYTEEDFRSFLRKNHLLLILDGMDEIATKHGTRQFLDAVSCYYKANKDGTTLFFTSRNEADGDLISINGQTPKRLTLRSLEEDQIKDYSTNLFLLLDKPNKSESFYLSIETLADEIRTNPLLLSQLAIVYDKKNEIPKTTVGIYDAVCEITLKHEQNIAEIPDSYRDMVTLHLSSILQAFAAERYRLAQEEENYTAKDILTFVLETNNFPGPADRAEFLLDYLNKRAILIEDEFYHKMLLEYFTAVDYY